MTETLDLFGREIDNVRAALDWSFSPRGDLGIGVNLTAVYVPMWLRLALAIECRDRTRHAIDRLAFQPKPDWHVLTWLYFGLGAAQSYTGDKAELIKANAAVALDAADRTNDAGAQLRILYLLWAIHHDTAEAHTAGLFAERLSQIALREDSIDEVTLSERAVAASLLTAGRLEEARLRTEKCLAHYVESQRYQRFALANFNQHVLIEAVLGTVLWLQGFADQARMRAHDCVENAVANGDNFTHMQALRESVCRIYLMTGDLADAEQSVTALLSLATRYGFSQFLQTGNCWQGVLLIKRQDFAAGTVLLRRALEACEASGWTMLCPEFLGVLAEGLTGLGRFAEASDAVASFLDPSRYVGGGRNAPIVASIPH